MIEWLQRRLAQWMAEPGLPVWYHPAYRLPVSAAEGAFGIDPRRADYAAWYLVQTEACQATQLKTPAAISFEHLQRVHSTDYLESLWLPATLAGMLGLAPQQVPVDEVLGAVRLACGGTLAAARWALEHRAPALNLLGGFHRAGPDFGSGLSPLNDLACAIAALRADGFAGRVAIIDLDAHPPDGTAACLASDPAVWIGSVGVAGDPIVGVERFEVPAGCDNATYRLAFEALVHRLPAVDLAMVVAGGDVLAGDRSGQMRLDLRGVRRRDLALARALKGVPAVWLPGGGYHSDAWRALAGTALALSGGSSEPIPEHYDPMGEHYARLSSQFRRPDSPETWITADDLVEALRVPGVSETRLLGTYTLAEIDFALTQFGILGHLRRLGYSGFSSLLDRDQNGDRLRVFGTAFGVQHLLVECVLAREWIAGVEMLYVHWMTLRNPAAAFGGDKRRLPGQEVPGLGLARESGELLIRVADRLGLGGLAFRPAWYHTAYAGRYYLRFVDPARQGRFEALMRDLAGMDLLEATSALDQGRVRLDGQPYTWEADPMAFWLAGPPDDAEQVAAERDRVRFSCQPKDGSTNPSGP